MPLLALVLVGALVAPVMAQPVPGDVAKACIERMKAVTTECVQAIATQSARAANRINELQAADNDARARQVAREANELITVESRRCRNRIHEIAENCVRALRKLEADPALIETVRKAAARSQAAIGTALENGRRKIAAALAD
jgi:hypothetical protein